MKYLILLALSATFLLESGTKAEAGNTPCATPPNIKSDVDAIAALKNEISKMWNGYISTMQQFASKTSCMDQGDIQNVIKFHDNAFVLEARLEAAYNASKFSHDLALSQAQVSVSKSAGQQSSDFASLGTAFQAMSSDSQTLAQTVADIANAFNSSVVKPSAQESQNISNNCNVFNIGAALPLVSPLQEQAKSVGDAMKQINGDLQHMLNDISLAGADYACMAKTYGQGASLISSLH